MLTFLIPFPPLPEQRAIAAYLDRETARIDLAEGGNRSQHRTAGRYRAALISAVVTGKIDVRGLQPASRLDDLIDLVQTTNEVYFITAPGRVRTAFILADDIVELALKTFLQEKALEQREQCLNALQAAGWVTSNNHRNAPAAVL